MTPTTYTARVRFPCHDWQHLGEFPSATAADTAVDQAIAEFKERTGFRVVHADISVTPTPRAFKWASELGRPRGAA